VYIDLRELDRELEIAKSTTAAFQGTYDLFNRRLEGGAASALETVRAEASLAQVAAQTPRARRAIVARRPSQLLLGRNPHRFRGRVRSSRSPGGPRRVALDAAGAAARHPAGGAGADRGDAGVGVAKADSSRD